MPIVFTTPGDETRAALVRAAAPRAVILPPLDLRRFLSVLATCRVLVSGDTGPAHMADALGVPRVTIFGPTSSVHWCPPVPTAIALRAPDAETVRLRDRARQVAEGRDFTGAISARMVLESVHTLLAGARVPERAAGAADERRA
jgi:ADP-heptose:LPS heptosyltransferase